MNSHLNFDLYRIVLNFKTVSKILCIPTIVWATELYLSMYVQSYIVYLNKSDEENKIILYHNKEQKC
jgi:hypothetical protein